MSITVSFYSVFNKRKNSTKQPAPGSYSYKSDINCLLKEPTSVKNPVLIVAGADYNLDYAYIAAWNKYYYIDDIVSISNTEAEYHLSEDILASNKAYITSSSQKCMIAYASMGWDARQIDPRIPTKVTKQAQGVATADIFASSHYLLEVICNDDSASSGFTQAYILSEAGMNKVRKWFGDNSIWSSLHNYFDGTPLQGVVSCKWIPYFPVSGYAAATTVNIGNRNSGTDGYFFTSGELYLVTGFPVNSGVESLTIPYIYGDYRQFEPYTTALIYLPGVGNTSLTLSDWQGSKVNVSYTIEILTGIVNYQLYTDAGFLVQTATGNLASQCPISENTNTGAGVVQALSQTMGGMASLIVGGVTGSDALAVGGMLNSIAGASNTIMNTTKHAPSLVGQTGGRGAALRPYISIAVIAQNTEDPDAADWIAEKGRPVNKVMAMNTFTSGYVQTIDAHIKMAGTVDDRLEVESYLNNGIFIE